MEYGVRLAYIAVMDILKGKGNDEQSAETTTEGDYQTGRLAAPTKRLGKRTERQQRTCDAGSVGFCKYNLIHTSNRRGTTV